MSNVARDDNDVRWINRRDPSVSVFMGMGGRSFDFCHNCGATVSLASGVIVVPLQALAPIALFTQPWFPQVRNEHWCYECVDANC
jgi:hypothetical protein